MIENNNGNRTPNYPNSTDKNQRNNFQNAENADSFFSTLNFKSEWITAEADKDMIMFAEKTGKFMAKNKLTSSKIRSIYGEIKRIQMGEFEKDKASFYLLKPKVAYALGRDNTNEGLKLFKLIFDNVSLYVSNDKNYNNFCNLIEAMLAYHKFYGGKD